MRSTKSTFSIAVAVLVLFTSAVAQNWTVQVDIPFKFTVKQQTLLAGEYRVSINGPGMVRVARIDGHDTAEAMTGSIRGTQNANPMLSFHLYGERYFLAEVWLGEPNCGYQLFATSAELELARTTKQDTITIVAKQSPAK